MKASTIAATLAGALVVAVAGVASATQTTSSLQVYDGVQGDMIAGSGIPIDNFTQNSYTDIANDSSNTIYVSLKARDRDTGEANSQTGNDYYIDPGYSSTSPSKPNLEYDYQFDPGSDGITDFYLQLKVDFDPSAGTDFATIGGNVSSFWVATEEFFFNGTDGSGGTNAWNTNAVPYVVSNSGNLGFSFWSTAFGKSYDPNQSGDYEIEFNVFDPTDTTYLTGSTIHAIVGNPLEVSVPEPGEIELMGLGLLLIGGLTWRSRRKQARLA